MTNKEIYQKVLPFSLWRLLVDIGAFVLAAVLTGGGFLLMEKVNGKGLQGLVVGLLLGIVALVLILRYVSYTYKAGQIAMMTKAITEDRLPDNVVGEGKAFVKDRFVTVAVYFAITGAIRAIFNQLARGLNALGRAVGGDNGGTAADVVSSVVSVVVGYLCDCCLGWIFYRQDVKPAKAGCEGAVLFFRHGKTLLKNLGRVFGLGLVSLIVIGGIFFGIFYAIFSAMPAVFERLAAEAAANGTTAAYLTNPHSAMMICAAVASVILWSILHSAFVRPFVLVGVMRNYIESGLKDDIPGESAFAQLDGKSARFKKLHAEAM